MSGQDQNRIPENNKESVLVDAIRQLAVIYQKERLLFLIFTAISFIIQIACIVKYVFFHGNDQILVTGMGSSGGVLVGIGSLLKMWERSVDKV